MLTAASLVRLQENSESFTIMMAKLTSVAHRIVDSALITIYLMDSITQELYCNETSGVCTRVPIGHGIVGHVAATRDLVRADNIISCEHYHEVYDALPPHVKPQACLCVPLVDEVTSKVIGVIRVRAPSPCLAERNVHSIPRVVGACARAGCEQVRRRLLHLNRRVPPGRFQLRNRVCPATEDHSSGVCQGVGGVATPQFCMIVALMPWCVACRP